MTYAAIVGTLFMKAHLLCRQASEEADGDNGDFSQSAD